jgi:hypothetical protein
MGRLTPGQPARATLYERSTLCAEIVRPWILDLFGIADNVVSESQKLRPTVYTVTVTGTTQLSVYLEYVSAHLCHFQGVQCNTSESIKALHVWFMVCV